MKINSYLLPFAILLAGIAGVIVHLTESSTVTNSYINAWFAAVFALSGLNLLDLCRKPHIPQKEYWFELAVIGWLFFSSSVSVICLGFINNWQSFAWVLVTLNLSLPASMTYLRQRKNAIVPVEHQTQTVITTKVIAAVVYLLKGVFLLIVSLLASGSIVSTIAGSFPPSGQPVYVLFDGSNLVNATRTVTLQMYCIGTSNVSKPTVFIFSSAAHGIVDFYGLQYFLSNETSRRVCIHDPLGFGWSQDPFDGQFTNYDYLYRLMLTSNEHTPWHIVGWGGGGSAVMHLAKFYPESIKSVTFVETYPPGIEFSYYGYQNGLSQQAISEYRSSQLSSRIGLVQLILSVAIPWGLMGLFIPLSPRHEGYYPPERWAEYRVQMWKSKVWISQYLGLRHLQITPDSQDPLVYFHHKFLSLVSTAT